MDIEKLHDPKLQEALQNAGSQEELLAALAEQGLELDDEELEKLSGGGWGNRHESINDRIDPTRHLATVL